MFFALALALIAVASGALVTYLFDDDAPLVARLCMGASIGLAGLGFFTFILASYLGLTPLTLTFGAALVASPFALLISPSRRAHLRVDLLDTSRGARRALMHPTRKTTVQFFFYSTVSVLIWLVFDRAMVELPDGIYTGVQNNYGDLPFHISIITSFADGANFPPEDPTYAGARFTYPFIADFVAACFVKCGATLRQAMFLENFVLALSFVGVLHRFTLKLSRDWVAGLIAPALVLLSGGLGWWHLLRHARESGHGLIGILMKLQQQYTITPDTGYRWGNSLTTLLIPQRGILLALPLAIIVFTVWWMECVAEKRARGGAEVSKTRKDGASRASRKPARARGNVILGTGISGVQGMGVIGVVAGLLPLVHAHSFIVVMVVGAGVALGTGLRQWRAWAAFFFTACLVAAPQMWWVTRGSAVRAGDFFGWNFGWDKGEENFLTFWFINTGLLIPLIVASIVWRNGGPEGQKYLVPRRLLLFYLPFTLCFIIPNLVKLAPWTWDNIKVLFYWFIASAPLVAMLLARLMRARSWARTASIVLLLTLTLAGALDVLSVASRAAEFRIFDAEGIAFAEIVKQQTPPRATILHEPTFDTPIFLTGRRSVMGYPGHVSSHGISYEDRLREIKRIYTGAPDGEGLLAKYGVEYVLVGPQERRSVQVNDAFFSRYPIVEEAGEYRLYKIARP